MENQYICHSGVKGMKWGVRKRIQESGSQAKVSSGVRNQQSDRLLGTREKYPAD